MRRKRGEGRKKRNQNRGFLPSPVGAGAPTAKKISEKRLVRAHQTILFKKIFFKGKCGCTTTRCRRTRPFCFFPEFATESGPGTPTFSGKKKFVKGAGAPGGGAGAPGGGAGTPTSSVFWSKIFVQKVQAHLTLLFFCLKYFFSRCGRTSK